MKTNGAGTRNPRLGLFVGPVLTLAAALALEGAGLRLVSDPTLRITGAAIAGGALVCLFGAVLSLAALGRERRRPHEIAPVPAGDPRARSPEEAAARAHAQKMEALGLLAGGVAHDFNNLLHVIRNSLEILQRQGPPAEAERYIGMIRRSAERATALTRQLLVFSRRQPLEVRPMDPNDLVAQMAELLRHSLGERITVETVLERGIGSIAADAGQLETALLNLAINARDAMSQAGRLTIETANAALDEPYVMIAVSDTGTGMTPEVAARACEPFFTTKEPGQGTGLGLSQVAGFVQQSGGHVRISSEPGKGTSIQLYLPRCGRAPERLPRRPLLAEPSAARPVPETARTLPLAVAAAPER
jgi:signal transduction histidine kinase